MMNINEEDYNDGYYHLSKDVLEYPEAVVYIIWSRRGPGKTYSALRYPYHKFKTLYVKRTNEDVKTICEFQGDIDFDPSPWQPLNRDFGTNVKPRLIKDGIGAFYDADEQGKPSGPVINYIASLNAIKRIKGMDLSDADWIIFDEFIPQSGEIVKHAEGEMLLSLYETINRDRRKRGRPGLKLILMANAEEISTPITNTLEVVDTIADMEAKQIHKFYDADRGIFFHHISDEDVPMLETEKRDMYRVMKGTAWADKSFGGQFSGNDFSNVCELSLKGMRCMYHLKYRRHNHAYIYYHPQKGMWYMTDVKGKAIDDYDLDRENEQKRFWIKVGYDMKDRCIRDLMKFKKYSYYDLIINYQKFYDI